MAHFSLNGVLSNHNKGNCCRFTKLNFPVISHAFQTRHEPYRGQNIQKSEKAKSFLQDQLKVEVQFKLFARIKVT